MVDILNDHDANTYVLAVGNAPVIKTALWLTQKCPECGLNPTHQGTQDEHRMLGKFVIIGCEGYFVVNPNALPGFDRPGWKDWRLSHA